MPADPVDLVLTRLSAIRSEIAQLNVKLDGHDKRIDTLGDRLGPQDRKITDALRFAALANLSAQNAEVRTIEVAEKQEKLELQIADLDRRLRSIEVPERS